MSMDVAPMRHARHSMSDDEETTQPQRAKAASQACETCRNRKVKCDEERPKCGVCVRLNTTCEYREPKPTKKDKTLVWISDTLKSIEKKVDFIVSAQSQSAPSAQSSLRPPALTATQSGFSSYQPPTGIGRNPYDMQDSSYSSMSPSAGRGEPSAPAMNGSSLATGSSLDWSGMATSVPASGDNTPQKPQRRQNEYQVELRKVLTWPAIRQMLNEYYIGPEILDSQGEPVEKWLTGISDGFIDALPRGEPIAFWSPSQPNWNTGIKVISMGMIQEYTNHFFLSYHCLYPILDEDFFRSHTILTAANGDFDRGDQQTTLILLVMALGEVAKEGVSGTPMRDEHTSMQTGVRGGDRRNPPGLAFVYEAQQRIGTAMTSNDTTVLHCYILLSLYYAQISRNMEYWRMTGYATQQCSAVVKCVENWDTFDSDIISRAYWMCILLEGGLVTELGLPPSGINKFDVGLPAFLRSQYSLNKQLGPRELRVKTTFLAQITLRAELNRINDSMRPFDGSPTSVRDSFPTYAVTEAHLASLRGWRAALPSPISWDDDDSPKAFPVPSSSSSRIESQYPSIPNSPQSRLAENQQILSNMRTVWSFEHVYPGISKITPTFDAIETVLEAALRTKYKYAQYLIFRPYLYKILHSGQNIAVTSPGQADGQSQPYSSHEPATANLPPPPAPPSSMELQITTDDVIGALNALKACTLWYLTHPVFRDQRRLLPHLYEYSHTMFGILLLFVAAERSSVLVTALEAAERGPSVTGSSGIGCGDPFHPGALSYPVAGFSSSPFAQSSQPASSSSSSSRPFGSTAQAQPGSGTASQLEIALNQMGVRGELEEFQYLREAIGLSKNCFLGWMGDMQVVHPIARWCWGVCKRIYGV